MIKDIIKIFIDSYSKNWITPRDGNISYKPANQNNFLISPSGFRKQELKESDFINIEFCDTSWNQLNNKNLKPSGEINLHLEILKSVKKELCVIHLHPTYTIAAMYSGLNLSSIASEFPELSRYTRVASNTKKVPPLSEELAVECKNNLIFDQLNDYYKYDIVGIPFHGVVSIGQTIYHAYEHIERLEHISKIVLSCRN